MVLRAPRLLALSAPLLFTLAASGGADGSPVAGTVTPPGGEAPAGEYPRTIDHAHGSTVIEAEPERIVTIGYTDQDFVLAFGVTPLAVTHWYGDYEGATWPWASDLIGDTPPEVLNEGTFDGSANFNYEAISVLEPDLILGLYIDVDAVAYDLLSAIAPTVVRPAEYPDFGVPWQESTRIVGDILGRPEQAEELIADVDQQLAEAAAVHPEFAGTTAAVVELFEPGQTHVRSLNDPRTQLLTALGFVLPEHLVELTDGTDAAPVSDELMELLDLDLLVWNVGYDPDLRAEIEAKPLYSQLDVVRRGHSVFIEDPLVSGALTWGTVLSIPFAVDSLVPQLADALAD